MSDAQTELKSSAAASFTGGSPLMAEGPAQTAPRHSIYTVSTHTPHLVYHMLVLALHIPFLGTLTLHPFCT